jgi:hypothetical protein
MRETSMHTGVRRDSEESRKYLRLTRRASEIEGGQDLGWYCAPAGYGALADGREEGRRDLGLARAGWRKKVGRNCRIFHRILIGAGRL